MSYLIKYPLDFMKSSVNSYFSGKEPWQIVTYTSTTVLFSIWFWNFVFQDECIVNRTKKAVFRWARFIPYYKRKVDEGLEEISIQFKNDVIKRSNNMYYFTELPTNSMKTDDIFKWLNKNLNLGDFDWKNGKVSGSVYFYDKELYKLVTDVYGMTSYTNPLHSDIFPGIGKLEAEVIRMAANLFNGGPDACGSITTGGTESLIMACKAYRDYALEHRNIKRPQILMPTTAHTGFDKAAQYLGLRVRTVKIDPITYKVDLEEMERLINSNTIMLVGSAPNFPYGTMDDIEAISYLGVKYNIPVHVDACLGGFLIAFMEEAGYPLPPFDFRLPGITSISADTHKYGFAPKGSSLILYREKKYIHHQYTVTTDWPGGVYGTPSICGSRAGGIIATCWATLLYFGNEGYVKATRDIIHTTHYIEKQLQAMDGIFVFGKPATSVIAIGSNIFDIYRLSENLSKHGWNLNALQFPSGIHICITHIHTQPGVADQFLNDVRKELKIIMKNPSVPVEGVVNLNAVILNLQESHGTVMAIYGVAQSLPDRIIVTEFVRLFLDSKYYIPDYDETKID